MGVKNMEILVYLHMNLAYEQFLNSKEPSFNLKELNLSLNKLNKPNNPSIYGQEEQNFSRCPLTINL